MADPGIVSDLKQPRRQGAPLPMLWSVVIICFWLLIPGAGLVSGVLCGPETARPNPATGNIIAVSHKGRPGGYITARDDRIQGVAAVFAVIGFASFGLNVAAGILWSHTPAAQAHWQRRVDAMSRRTSTLVR